MTDIPSADARRLPAPAWPAPSLPAPSLPGLAALGWSDPFARQIGPGEPSDPSLRPARVAGVERSHVTALDGEASRRLHAPGGTHLLAVGDWVLTDGLRVVRRLRATTEVARRVAGETSRRQLVATNVDALAIVTSCNADFNVARLERYLSVALAAGCEALVVLTKADLGDPAPLLAEARRLSPLVTALALDARDEGEARRLDPWAAAGRTLALVGSSGVGKTTLQTHLTGVGAATGGIREDDARGRHTTTARTLRPTLAGGCLIDTPGMRELGLVDAEAGVAAAFADLAEVAAGCRFRDCTHGGEPGCAVAAAVAAGTLDPGRVRRHEKLAREERWNSEAGHEAHARARAFGKMHRQIRKGGRFRAAPGAWDD